MSQGYNTVFSFIGNILQRLVEVTPKGSDYTKTAAIVLIDEVDTYLHPQWQYTILDYLVESFPNVQFIVTTHSHYVVGSIPNDKIKIYICEKEAFDAKVEAFSSVEEPINVYGSRLDLLNELVFKTPSRVGKVTPIIQQMRASLQQNDFDAVEKIRKKLVDMGIDIKTDPEISSLISLANTKKRMAKV
jgi:AAA domain, putative AbiEii toxin, Type IV TA system